MIIYIEKNAHVFEVQKHLTKEMDVYIHSYGNGFAFNVQRKNNKIVTAYNKKGKFCNNVFKIYRCVNRL